MRLADLSEHRLDRMQIVADRAVESDLTAAAALCDGDGHGVLVDIKPEIECSFLHGVFVVLCCKS
jgi:hypothetical protein